MIANLLLASIGTIEIIQLFEVNIFMPVTRFPGLTILLFCKRRPFWIFDQFRGLFKETNSKNLGSALRKKGREKTRTVKVAKSCCQVTWAQKNLTKKRKLE